MTSDNLPTLLELKKRMKSASDDLFFYWRQNLSDNIKNLQMKGFLVTENIVHCQLPNKYVRTALCRIQDELDTLGYDYKFRFDDVEVDKKLVLCFEIELPEDDDDTDTESGGCDAESETEFREKSTQT